MNSILEYKPIRGLSLKATIGVETLNYTSNNYNSSRYLYGASSASLSSNQQTTIVNENIMNYDLTVHDDHNLNFMGGFFFFFFFGT